MNYLNGATTLLNPRILCKLTVQRLVDLRADRIADELLNLVREGAHDSSDVRVAALEDIRSARNDRLENETFQVVALQECCAFIETSCDVSQI